MFRKTTTIATLAAASVTLLPGAAQAGDVQAAAKLEASAVVNSDRAVDLARENARKAEALVNRSEAAMKQAFAKSVDEGKAAYVKFSAAAEAQSENLSTVVEKSRGELEREAADALAATAKMEATLVARLAQELERSDEASSEQGEAAADMGGDHASIAAEVAVVLSTDNLQAGVRRELDATARKSAEAQARLAAAVEELRQRSEGESKSFLAGLADALARGGRWDVSYQKTIGDDSSPAKVSVAAQAHASVGQGGRR